MCNMEDFMQNKIMGILIFLAGAAGYSSIEYLFRGYTHWSMALTGGACLLAFYYYTKEHKKTPTVAKALAGACIITVFEFFVGLIVNLWYGWHVWDYSREPGNLLGQICPRYFVLWFLLSLVALFISNILCSVYRVFQRGIQD